MLNIKKNTYMIFYIILFIGTIILSIIINNIYINVKHEYVNNQENITKINTNNINSLFLQYEMILNILGNELSLNDNYKSLKDSRFILDKLVKLDSSIIAFGLSKPNGQLYITSTNIISNNDFLPNLLMKEETKESFSHTLTQDIMVLGRTYFHKELNALIIPMRKTIRDNHNRIIAVMTAAIDVKKAFSLFYKDNEAFTMYRDFDSFYQLTTEKNVNYEDTYEKKIPKEIVNNFISNVVNKYNKSLNTIKKEKLVVSVRHPGYLKKDKNKEYLSSFIYIQRYNLWVFNQTSIETINKKAHTMVFIFILIFICIYFIIFLLFRFINTFEKNKQNEFYYQATHDSLTNLKNKLYLLYEYKNIINTKPFTLLIIDIDNFKSINDNYSHDYGDIVLKEISKRLESLNNKNDLVLRYSADEFLFIRYDINENEIKLLAQNILDTLDRTFNYNEYDLKISASIGISSFPKDGISLDEVKRHADIALGEAKKLKKTFCIFKDSIKLTYLKNSLIEDELKTALENKEIYMTYQAQVNENGELYGVEALVRWNNKKLGFISPEIFIKIAEQSGLMRKLGKFIISTALTEINSLYKRIGETFQLSINISHKQFVEDNFYENILNNMNKIKFKKNLLTLEVTENIFIEDIDFILKLLHRIRKDGVKISLDDFGTGYSSLSLLKKLPIDELKIDKSFVEDILIDKNSLSMVESIISIGKKFNMVILAEGVETQDQKRILQESNCDLFQGYLYSKPLKINDLEIFLNTIKKK